jgi:hypothetical protein
LNTKIVSVEEDAAIATIAGVAAGATPILVNAISASAISAAGFTTSGVAAGSLAATMQAGLGGMIAKGSTFALMQSAGATGAGVLGVTISAPLIVAAVVVGPLVGAYMYFW